MYTNNPKYVYTLSSIAYRYKNVGSPTAATSVEDLIRAPTVCHSQVKVLVDRVEKSDTSLLISLVLLNHEIIHNHTYVALIQMDIIQYSILYSYDLMDALQCYFPRHTVRNA